MLFNSLEFAVFLAVTFVAYWGLAARNLRRRNAFLLVASYVFYGFWDVRFLALIFASSLVDFTVGLGLARTPDPARRRALLCASLLINLGMLGTFKYFDFFLQSLSQLLTAMGLSAIDARLELILPVGISFYTFQTLSYTIDVFRRRLEPVADPLSFFAYVAFFPQLVAGPIERAKNLLPQFARIEGFREDLARDGSRQMLWGFFKKMVVADGAARLADPIFAAPEAHPPVALAMGAIFFSFQIYGDFSGYSDIAIGCSKLFGIRLSTNFQYPYFSRNVAEFWRRWHVSLSAWFRDYVYLPLGGSRTSRSRTARNVGLVFVLSGIWHGANWTFLAWGALNALLCLPLVLKNSNTADRSRRDADAARLRDLPRILATFALMTLLWIFFRAESLSLAGRYLAGLMTLDGWDRSVPLRMGREWLVALAPISVMLLVEWSQRAREHALAITGSQTWTRWLLYQLVVLLFFFFGDFGAEGFIYFQF